MLHNVSNAPSRFFLLSANNCLNFRAFHGKIFIFTWAHSFLDFLHNRSVNEFKVNEFKTLLTGPCVNSLQMSSFLRGNNIILSNADQLYIRLRHHENSTASAFYLCPIYAHF